MRVSTVSAASSIAEWYIVKLSSRKLLEKGPRELGVEIVFTESRCCPLPKSM